MEKMIRCAVIGNPIAHSLSPFIHVLFAKAHDIALSYEKLLGTDDDFASVVQDFFDSGGRGLNITLPFKAKAFSLAENKTSYAEDVGVANTLWRDKETRLTADNTDGRGLLADLSSKVCLKDQRILLLGAGGASAAVIPALLSQNPQCIHIANRTEKNALPLTRNRPSMTTSNLENIPGEYDLIINATSSSLLGYSLPIPSNLFKKSVCYDMTYSKNVTPFLQQAKEQGATEIQDGLGMLVHQAAFAFSDWFHIMPETAPVLITLRKHLQR